MGRHADLLDLVAALYAAARDRGRWRTALTALARTVGARDAALFLASANHSGRGAAGPAALGDGDERGAAGRRLSEFLARPLRSESPGLEPLDTRFDARAPGSARDRLAAAVARSGARLVVLTARSGRGDPPFARRDAARFRGLVPHVAGALAHHLAPTSEPLPDRAAAQVLEMLPVGVALLDGRGRVVHANAAARRLLATEDGLSLEDGRLRGARASDDDRLAAMLSEVVSCGPAGRVLTIPRRSGRRDYQVSAVGLTGTESAGAGTAVFLRDPDDHAVGAPEHLMEVFRLSRAEAALAAALARGQSIAEYAGALGLSHHTVRTLSKRVFRKTGTRGQSELVGLVIRSAPPAAIRALAPARADAGVN